MRYHRRYRVFPLNIVSSLTVVRRVSFDENPMSWYYRRLFPWLLELSMKQPQVERYRKLLVPQAKGRVLEIGFGSGLNLPFYGSQIEQLCGLEPSAELREMAARRAQKSAQRVQLLDGSAEQIALPDHS